jgi:DNA invertase Pin-like site-specific DNA recombinase
MTKGKRAAIYTRVSTNSQTTENQLLELRRVAEARGWTIVEVYTDEGISGAKGRDKRPAFDKLMKDATRHRFDIVMAWSIDRIGRSVHAVSGFIAEMESLGVAQYYQQQAIDTSTPAGKAMVHMCVVFAEFERDMIRERIMAGLERAKAHGTRLGRPKIPAAKAAAIRRALGAGKGIVSTARKVGVGVLTVQRIKAELAAS